MVLSTASSFRCEYPSLDIYIYIYIKRDSNPVVGLNRPRGWIEIQLYPFFDLGARMGCGQHHTSAALPPEKKRYLFYRRLGGPQGRSRLLRKISPLPGFVSRTVQSIASHYTDWATQPHIDVEVTFVAIPAEYLLCRAWPSVSWLVNASEYLGNLIACRYACVSSGLEIFFLPSELRFMNLWFCRLTVYVSTNTTPAWMQNISGEAKHYNNHGF
jgi:hypothetical protein